MGMSGFEIIGLMSGTSMDGLDIAHVRLDLDGGNDRFELKNCATYELPFDIKKRLLSAPFSNVQRISQLDHDIALFYAKSVNEFIVSKNIEKKTITAIASHGQTILHQPWNGFSLQIGHGTTLAFNTGIQVINDFRNHDVAAGGQGAPLVPIGDFGIFNDLAEGFLNIGGFVNFSYKDALEKIIAYDICPGNLPLNKLVNSKELSFDKDGALAASGEINFYLLDLLNSLEFYNQIGPKSLGTEWLEEHFYPKLRFDKEIENNLRTVVEHIAIQTGQKLNDAELKTVFVTGGGAKNHFLIQRIQHYFNGQLIIPDKDIIDFKEAIIFAYLGALYLENRPNALSSVTGATRNMICGVLHKPGF
jgi:anhydro-N-acetylmuramic acid kinase